MGRTFGGSNMPHCIRNDILDFLRAMSVKILALVVQVLVCNNNNLVKNSI